MEWLRGFSWNWQRWSPKRLRKNILRYAKKKEVIHVEQKRKEIGREEGQTLISQFRLFLINFMWTRVIP